MQTVLIIALSLHVLAAVFWAGGTFVMARGAGDGPRLAKPMAGAALVTLLSGGYLWRALHGAAFGKPETVLAVGIVCALLAFALQAGGGAVTRGQIKRGVLTADSARARMIAIQRIAAPLLASRSLRWCPRASLRCSCPSPVGVRLRMLARHWRACS